MFTVEQFQEECRVISSRGSQSEFIDRSDLFLQLGTQGLFVKSRWPPKFDDTCILGFFFLLFRHSPLGAIFFFGTWNANRGLRLRRWRQEQYYERKRGKPEDAFAPSKKICSRC